MTQVKTPKDVLYSSKNGVVKLLTPYELPLASAYLYNDFACLQLNCRGYARAQFMQPEPSKYSFSPVLEAKTFMQPEQGYFTHHPGRFFYIKDNHSQSLFSAPFDPCRVKPDRFEFIHQKDKICWLIETNKILIEIEVTLAESCVAELWQLTITNLAAHKKNISLYPYFSIGYQSWMNREADFDPKLQAIIAKSITPYQQLSDYYQNQSLKDSCFLLSQETPNSWTCHRDSFEGLGGLHAPDAIVTDTLPTLAARYEDPVAVMQFDMTLVPNQQRRYCFAFGPAKDKQEIAAIKEKVFKGENFQDVSVKNHIDANLKATSEFELAELVNHWLPIQVHYHGKLHRLSTDPQTRNYLQDAIGMCFIDPAHTKHVILSALAQQKASGEMPDGILLNENAQLKYINQVPHADANIWLPIVLLAYLDETNDRELLSHPVKFCKGEESYPVYQHIELALEFVLNQRDERGLCLIHQGDWCDPMNMVGHKGKGVSSWLTLALAVAIKHWLLVIARYGNDIQVLKETVPKLNAILENLNDTVNLYCWQGNWYARGITDDNKLFGIDADSEGKIYLNPQSWALLSGAATTAKKFTLLNEVERQLNTPFGMMMLAPAYTAFRDDIGRLTQKYPGSAENGSIYNHAAVFYAYALYQVGEYTKAYQVLLKLIPTAQDAIAKGQMPNFIPNYYRGAYHQLPTHAGRSSHLIHTGTAAWAYRCIIEELFGFKGESGNLRIQPKLPENLTHLSGVRYFQHAVFTFTIKKAAVDDIQVSMDGDLMPSNLVTNIVAGKRYALDIKVPK